MDRLIAPYTVNLAGADTAPAAGTPQYATDGDPQAGVPATIFPAYAWNMIQEEVRAVIVAAGLVPDKDNWAQLALAVKALGMGAPYALLQDQKPSGTAGGTATGGAWRTRDLNTEVWDPAAIVSLASNQFTLQAGTYRVRAVATAMNVQAATARLQNITDGATVGVGLSVNSTGVGSGDGVTVRSDVTAAFTIAGAKAFELQQYPSATQAADGFGSPSGVPGAVEIYSQVEIWKVG